MLSLSQVVCLFLFLCSFLSTCYALDQPILDGDCGPPNPCEFGRQCILIPTDPPKHQCSCRPPFSGVNCTSFSIEKTILTGRETENEVLEGSWAYHLIQIPFGGPNYENEASLNISLSSLDNTNCNFALVDGSIRFFTEWGQDFDQVKGIQIGKNKLNKRLTISSLNELRVSLSVHAPSGGTCKYKAMFIQRDDPCFRGDFIEGKCKCKKHWAGANCNQFSFALVFMLSIAAGTFIIGAVSSSIISGLYFSKRQYTGVPQTQAYERFYQ